MTFSKFIVTLLLINGIIWTYMSYYLAYLGRDQIAETLSTAVLVQILGVVVVYSAKALFENLSKNNHWPDKTAKTVKKEEVTTYEQP